MNNLVTTDWLEKNLSKVRVIDATWHMPNLKRESYKEYLKTHISGSVFLTLIKILMKNLLFPICYQTKKSGRK